MRVERPELDASAPRRAQALQLHALQALRDRSVRRLLHTQETDFILRVHRVRAAAADVVVRVAFEQGLPGMLERSGAAVSGAERLRMALKDALGPMVEPL
jgi:HEAT repeat protein